MVRQRSLAYSLNATELRIFSVGLCVARIISNSVRLRDFFFEGAKSVIGECSRSKDLNRTACEFRSLKSNGSVRFSMTASSLLPGWRFNHIIQRFPTPLAVTISVQH